MKDINLEFLEFQFLPSTIDIVLADMKNIQTEIAYYHAWGYVCGLMFRHRELYEKYKNFLGEK